MAHPHILSLSLTTLLLFAAANGDTTTVHGLTVAGHLCCTAIGNCPGRGIGVVAVELRCLKGRHLEKFGYATTTSDGSFKITVRSIDGIQCGAVVRLPLNNVADCSELSSGDRVLVSGLLPAGTVASRELELVRNATLMGFKKYAGI